MIFYTVSTRAELYKAKVLKDSLVKYMNNITFIVCLLEETRDLSIDEQAYFDNIVLVNEIGIKDFDHFMFKHSVYESKFAIKGQLLKYLMDFYNFEDIFVFLTINTFVTDSLDEIILQLQNNSILLTPQINEPEKTIETFLDTELALLKYGVFNSGFLAIKRSDESERFVDWYIKRLETACYDDIKNGVYLDQKWLNFVPSYFNAHILKHPGYNVGVWNFTQRSITISNSGKFHVNREPIKFFNFSDDGLEYFKEKYIFSKDHPYYQLQEIYYKELDKSKTLLNKIKPCIYDFFKSGEEIEYSTRILFRTNYWNVYKLNGSPFNFSNKYIIDCLVEGV